MTGKDKAFESFLNDLGKTHGPFNTRDLLLVSTAVVYGWDAHAELVRPLVEAARKLAKHVSGEDRLDDKTRSLLLDFAEKLLKHDALFPEGEPEGELARQSDHYASCIAPLLAACAEFIKLWHDQADVHMAFEVFEREYRAVTGSVGTGTSTPGVAITPDG